MNKTIKTAYKIALYAHRGQKYGKRDYVHHLLKVDRLLQKFNASDLLRTIGILHDALEDIGDNYPDDPLGMFQKCYQDISQSFGNIVAINCLALINNPNTKEARYNELLEENKVWARATKVADRIANINAGLAERRKPRNKYIKQHENFSKILFSTLETNATGVYGNAYRVGFHLSKAYNELIAPFLRE